MSKALKVVEITACKHWCPFFGISMDGMECNHPYFDEAEAYANMIINHDGDIPKECPLRKEPLEILYKLNI